jgi:hypothetical protein
MSSLFSEVLGRLVTEIETRQAGPKTDIYTIDSLTEYAKILVELPGFRDTYVV